MGAKTPVNPGLGGGAQLTASTGAHRGNKNREISPRTTRLIATFPMRFTGRNLDYLLSGVVLGGGSEVGAQPTLSRRVRVLTMAIVLFMVSVLFIDP